MMSRLVALTVPGLVTVIGLFVVGIVGLVTHEPWLFPSLGPTLMVLGETPDQPAARPRNVLLGHGVGIAAGWFSLAVTGLLGHPSAVQEGISGARVLAAALSLALTTAVLILLDAPHPPAGATTLIVSLGILTQGAQLATMAGAVVLVLLVALGVRTLAATVGRGRPADVGHPHPVVSGRSDRQGPQVRR